jgi:hypothetical protein
MSNIDAAPFFPTWPLYRKGLESYNLLTLSLERDVIFDDPLRLWYLLFDFTLQSLRLILALFTFPAFLSGDQSIITFSCYFIFGLNTIKQKCKLIRLAPYALSFSNVCTWIILGKQQLALEAFVGLLSNDDILARFCHMIKVIFIT